MSNYLGFNPRDLGVFQAPQTVDEQSLVYKTMPENSKSEDGVYRSQIRILYNVFDIRNSIVEKQTYALRDADGFFSVDSALSLNDRNCPIFKAWKKLRYSDDPAMQELGSKIFEKRFSRWCLVQVVDDPNKPELNGKYMFFKLPKFLWDLMQAKMNPAAETRKAPVPVMDFMRGTVVDISVAPGPDDPLHPERKKREISYSTSEITSDVMPVTRPDGTSFLTEDEQAVVDKYIEMEAAANKKRKPEERDAALAKLAEDTITVQVSALYEKVAEELKKVCPDLGKEIGYNYYDKAAGLFWEPSVQKRVENFCALAVQGIDPAKPTVVINEAAATPAPAADPAPEQPAPEQPAPAEPGDDLPF